MITNKSDSVNSLRELKLFIEHGRKLGPFSNVSIPHDTELAQYLPKGSGDPLFIPCQIAAHAVLGGVAIFRVPDELLEQSRVESYMLKLIDSYGLETELEAILLSEVRDDPTDENRNATR
jgi:hypothetical protein